MTNTLVQVPVQDRTYEAADSADGPSGESATSAATRKWGDAARRARRNCSTVDADTQLSQRRQTSAE